MNDGDPKCHVCRGKGESQGRGETHPCMCLHWRIHDMSGELARLRALAEQAISACREEAWRSRACEVAVHAWDGVKEKEGVITSSSLRTSSASGDDKEKR